jgi:nicotinamide riboside kinase
MKTTIINLYGGPSAGKSTSAAYLYYLLKCQGESVELVREYVKNWAWDNRAFNVYDELYFLGKQVRHESMLFGKVKYIVTDAPVFMTAYYAKLYCSAGLAQGVEQAACAFYQQAKDDGHEHRHIYLMRNKPYKAEGRYQTEEQAVKVDIGIADMLEKLNIPFTYSVPDEQSLRDLLTMIQTTGK